MIIHGNRGVCSIKSPSFFVYFDNGKFTVEVASKHEYIVIHEVPFDIGEKSPWFFVGHAYEIIDGAENKGEINLFDVVPQLNGITDRLRNCTHHIEHLILSSPHNMEFHIRLKEGDILFSNCPRRIAARHIADLPEKARFSVKAVYWSKKELIYDTDSNAENSSAVKIWND